MNKILLLIIATSSCTSLIGMEMQIVPLHASTNTGDPQSLSMAPQQSAAENTQLLNKIKKIKQSPPSRCCSIRLRRAQELGDNNCERAGKVTGSCLAGPVLISCGLFLDIFTCPANCCLGHGLCPLTNEACETGKVDCCPCFTCED